MNRSAKVVDVCAGQRVLVELNSSGQCQRCLSGSGCGGGLLISRPTNTRLSIPVSNPNHFEIGQHVVVTLPDTEPAWFRLAILAYALPLFGMILATFIATWLALGGIALSPVGLQQTSPTDEIFILVSAIGGLSAGIFLWRCLTIRLSASIERSLCLQSVRIESSISALFSNETHYE